MPIYMFELLNGSSPLRDAAGVDLPDAEHALAYGGEIARELMQGREAQTRFWQLRIYERRCGCESQCDCEGFIVSELTLATVDRTLAHLAPDLRSKVIRLCDNHRSCKEAVHAARINVREARAVVALSRGELHLAAVGGERTIRSDTGPAPDANPSRQGRANPRTELGWTRRGFS